MPQRNLAPHGNFHVRWCDDVLYTELIGTFNVEAMRGYVAQVKAFGGARNSRWGRLANMRRWEGMTPEAAIVFEEFAEWVKTTECKVSVQLLPESFQKTVATNFARRLHTRHLYQSTDPAEAIKVLADYKLQTAGLADLIS